MLYNYNILFTKFVIFLSFWVEGGGVSFEELKKFTGNPMKFGPCTSVISNEGTHGESCGDKICKVWNKLYDLDPFVKKEWTSIFAKSPQVDKDIRGKSPVFSFYLAMWIYHDENTPAGCENFIEPNNIENKTFEELIESLSEWWRESSELRVKTNQILDSESLKLYSFIKEKQAQRGLFRVKLTGGQSPLVIDTTFSTDCGKFMKKIIQWYGKFTRHSKCQTNKWEVLKAAAEKLDWTSKNAADPEELCSPEMKAALEYEVKRMTKFDKTNCKTSLQNLKNVVSGDIGCVAHNAGLSTVPNPVKSLKTRYQTCFAELKETDKNLEKNFINLKQHPFCFHPNSKRNCGEVEVKQFETAMFVARVWSKYATDYLLFTPLRMFYIRSLVPYLDLTKYPLTSLAERVPPDLVRAFTTALRLVTRIFFLPINILFSALLLVIIILIPFFYVPAMIVNAVL